MPQTPFDASLLPYAGVRKKTAEYDVLSNGGGRGSVGIARTLHNTEDPVIVNANSRNKVAPQRQAVSQRLPPPDVLKPKKSLRELNLEKQRQRDQEGNLYPGLAGKIHNSPSRHHESFKLQNQMTIGNNSGVGSRLLDYSASYGNQPTG